MDNEERANFKVFVQAFLQRDAIGIDKPVDMYDYDDVKWNLRAARDAAEDRGG